MIISIESKKLRAEISTLGAEIHHLVNKEDGTEYIWNGDPSVWKNHAPILFPYVGRCKKGFYFIDGEKYDNSTNHGFARNLETDVITQEKDRAVFCLRENSTTLSRYPYKFQLETEYKITDKGLNWKITVKNNDRKPMSFCLGTHPAFACPKNTDSKETKISDYVIEFEKKENIKTVALNEKGFTLPSTKGGLIKENLLLGEKGFIPVTEKGFGVGLCLTDFTSEWIGLRNTRNGSIVKISTKGFPYCMLWQNDKGSPQFVCIEPWYGLPDMENTEGYFETKPALNRVEPGESFVSVQNISVE